MVRCEFVPVNDAKDAARSSSGHVSTGLTLSLYGEVLSLDGKTSIAVKHSAKVTEASEAEALGAKVGEELSKKGAIDLLVRG